MADDQTNRWVGDALVTIEGGQPAHVALERWLPGLPVTGLAAGLHVVLGLPTGVDEDRVARLAARRDVRVVPAGRYRVGTTARPPALVVGYGNLVDARLDEAVARLAAAVSEAAPSAARELAGSRALDTHES